MPGRKPQPFTYKMDAPPKGKFTWDGRKGTATYEWGDTVVHCNITFYIRSSAPNAPDYWVFWEDKEDETGRYKGWMFEVEPRENETRCTVRYFHQGDTGSGTPYGMAYTTDYHSSAPSVNEFA